MEISITFHHRWGGSMFWKMLDGTPFEIGYDPDKQRFFPMMYADEPANDNTGPLVAA